MRKLARLVAVSILMSCAASSLAKAPADPKADSKPDGKDGKDKDGKGSANELQAESETTHGTVTIGGRTIGYTAVAGTLIVHRKGEEDPPEQTGDDDKPPKPRTTAAMSYVAYFAGSAPDPARPLMFLYNGGPGSATIWLHMGAFGPRRVVTADDTHTAAAPYKLIENGASLLDAADLVFVDAPGTGFGRIVGKDKDTAFWGVDKDAQAFSTFVTEFLTKYGRWNSPKYLFGESYGTTRSAILALLLETDKSVDLNGVILLSQILCFDNSIDGAEANPSIDVPYQLALPTYAATAWYHKKLPDQPASLDALIAEVEKFAMSEYAAALAAGTTLDPAQRKAVIDKLHRYTGLSAAYLDKANLRVTGGEFEKELLDDADLTTGRLDSRFSGPTMDPLSKTADYDPQSAAISSAYVSVFNDYARKQLHFGGERQYKLFADVFSHWSWNHEQPGAGFSFQQTTNVMPDLAAAMKYNPNLHVQLDAGYFDIATPFYEGVYELQHLAIPQKLAGNVEMHFYASGHMVYANEASLKALHDNVADFVKRTYAHAK
jgi:carboxypeptidase C (cathepsin A)